MKLEAYCVHDSAVGAFNRPQDFRARGEALRSFSDAVSNPEAGFSNHAAHYSFYFIGVYDDATGELVANAGGPERVCGAQDFLIPSSSGPAGK